MSCKRATTNGFSSSGSSRGWKVILVTTLSLYSLLVFVVVLVVICLFADVHVGPSSYWANRGFSIRVASD